MSNAIADWLDRIGVDTKRHGTDVGTNDINIDCPWCGKEKHLGIHRVNGWLNCWACGFAGMPRRPWLASLIMELEGLPYALAKTKALDLLADTRDYAATAELFERPMATWLPPQCFPFFAELRSQLQEASQRLARQYLNTRDVTDALISHYKLLFTTADLAGGDPWRGRVVVPFYESGQIVNWVARDYTGTATQRYRNCPADQALKRSKELLFGLEEFRQAGLRHARIVEGVFDKFTIGPTALAVSKGGCSPEQLLLLRELKLQAATVIFDPTTTDDWYSLQRAVELAQNLSTFVGRVKVLRLTGGDVSELGWAAVAAAEVAAPLFTC